MDQTRYEIENLLIYGRRAVWSSCLFRLLRSMTGLSGKIQTKVSNLGVWNNVEWIQVSVILQVNTRVLRTSRRIQALSRGHLRFLHLERRLARHSRLDVKSTENKNETNVLIESWKPAGFESPTVTGLIRQTINDPQTNMVCHSFSWQRPWRPDTQIK